MWRNGRSLLVRWPATTTLPGWPGHRGARPVTGRLVERVERDALEQRLVDRRSSGSRSMPISTCASTARGGGGAIGCGSGPCGCRRSVALRSWRSRRPWSRAPWWRRPWSPAAVVGRGGRRRWRVGRTSVVVVVGRRRSAGRGGGRAPPWSRAPACVDATVVAAASRRRRRRRARRAARISPAAPQAPSGHDASFSHGAHSPNGRRVGRGSARSDARRDADPVVAGAGERPSTPAASPPARRPGRGGAAGTAGTPAASG